MKRSIILLQQPSVYPCSRDKKIEGLEAKHEILSSRLKDVIQQHEECQQLLSEANKEKKGLENRLAELQNCAKYEK